MKIQSNFTRFLKCVIFYSFGEVCCHLDDIVEEPKPKSCSVYERDGYNCEAPNNCLDEIISHGGEGLFGVRQADSKFHDFIVIKSRKQNMFCST